MKFTKPKPFSKHRAGGSVVRIVRHSYGKKVDWFELTRRIKQRDGYRCRRCGAVEDPKNKVWLDVHHIIELDRGGTTTPSNLISLCRTCHKSKHRHMR